MEKYQIKKPSSVKGRKRVGRGPGSGHGKTCCRGENGQLSRSGSSMRPGFEGGQMPIQRRIPKRGFNNHNFRKEFQIVNLSQIAEISGEINAEVLYNKNIIKCKETPVKILGKGDLSKSITVTVDAFTDSAKEKIEKAGGKAVVKK